MRKSPTEKLEARKTFPALSPAELRLVVGGIPGVRGTGSGGGGYFGG